MKKSWCSVFTDGIFLQGIGSLMIGGAAIFALSQTSEVITNILKVQEQAEAIAESVNELKESNRYLGGQIRSLVSRQAIANSKALQSQKIITVLEAKEAIKHIPTQASEIGGVYLPLDKVEVTAERLAKEKTQAARAQILQESLVIAKPGVTNKSKEKNSGTNEEPLEPKYKNIQ